MVAKITAHGDSSSPGPCTFRRGAEGAPCSGQTHPGRQASPGVSAEKERKGPRGGGGGRESAVTEIAQPVPWHPTSCLFADTCVPEEAQMKFLGWQEPRQGS